MVRESRSFEFWLEQIVNFEDRLSGHLSGTSREDFCADAKVVDAACWCISCIGEACGKMLEIDRDAERRYPTLDLSGAYFARNRYVHGYFDLDVGQVWDTAVVSVPRLAESARSILRERGR